MYFPGIGADQVGLHRGRCTLPLFKEVLYMCRGLVYGQTRVTVATPTHMVCIYNRRITDNYVILYYENDRSISIIAYQYGLRCAPPPAPLVENGFFFFFHRPLGFFFSSFFIVLW